jgi:hypothetical protein
MGANSGGSIADAGWQVRVVETILNNTFQTLIFQKQAKKKLGTGRGQIDLVIVEDLECVIQDCFSTSYINRGAIGYRPLILVIDQPSWAPIPAAASPN